MDYKIEQKPKSQILITVTTTAEETGEYIKAAEQRLSSKLKVDGFRPGKIPVEVIRSKVGTAAIFADAIDNVLPRLYAEIVIKEKLQPVSRPKADIVQEQPLKFTLLVDVLPPVKVGDVTKIKHTVKPEKVTEKQITETIDRLRQSFGEFSIVDRPAKLTDRVEIDFEGYDHEKKPIAGAKSTNHPLILGSGVFVPGFEEALVGVSKNDSKEFTVTFPKDYHAAEMQNKKVHFKVKVHSVEEHKLPAVDDAFAQRITGHKVQTATALKDEIRQSLEQQSIDTAKRAAEEKVLQELLDKTSVELPESMIDEETEYMLADLQQRLDAQGMTMERFLESQKQSPEQLRTSLKPAAVRRVTLRLALNEIAEREKIEPSAEEVEKAIAAEGGASGSDPERMRDAVRARLRVEHTLTHLYGTTIHSEKPKE